MSTAHDPTLPYEEKDSPEAFKLSEALIKEMDHWLSKYPANQRQSALIPSLLEAQRHHQGWLPQKVIDAVADYIQVPRIAAYEVATFYSMLELKPIGKYKLSICTNVSCMLNGCDKIVQHAQKRLGIQWNETTSDQKITLKESECLGACVKAPVIVVNDTYYEEATLKTIDTLLDAIEKEEL